MIRRSIWIVICCIYLVGCSNQRMPLENVSIILLMGLDKKADGDMIVGTSIPIFKNAKKQSTSEEIVEASSLYDGFSKVYTKITGFLTSSKVETILIGKNLSRQENWIKELDSNFRDPYGTLNAEVVIVDGSIEEIFNINKRNKPDLPSYISDVLKSSIHNNFAVSSTIQQLIRDRNEEGKTQSLQMIKRQKNEIKTAGIALLNKHGKYVTSIPSKDIAFYNLIKPPKKKGRMILHVPTDPKRDHQKVNTTLLVQDAKRKIRVNYEKGRFTFNIDIDIDASIIEKNSARTVTQTKEQKKSITKLENDIKQYLNKKFSSMLHHMQKNKVDPLGLSLYAKAYEYKEWKKVQKDWTDTLSKANIQVNTHIKIQNTGAVRSY